MGISGMDRDLSGVPKFAHVHIPKTGGISFFQTLCDLFEGGKYKTLNNLSACERFAELSFLDKLAFDVVGGHMTYGFDPELPRRFSYVAMLRDPVERLISHFTGLKYLQNNVDVSRDLRERDLSVLDFVRERDPRYFPWQHAELYFLGASGGLVGSLEILADRAVTNLLANFEFFGIVERHNESMALFEHQFGVETRVRPMNVTPKTAKISVSEAEREALRESLGLEIRLYDTAVRVFELRLREVPELEAKSAAIGFRREMPELATQVHPRKDP